MISRLHIEKYGRTADLRKNIKKTNEAIYMNEDQMGAKQDQIDDINAGNESANSGGVATPPLKSATQPNPHIKESEDLITKANAAAMRQEEANKQLKELLDRQERLQVQNTLSGKAEAGTTKKEETPAEYKERVLRGDL